MDSGALSAGTAAGQRREKGDCGEGTYRAFAQGGQPNVGLANTFGYGNNPLYGIPNIMTADGPAGVRFHPGLGVTATAFPCATLLASTWDPELCYEVGEAVALEAKENNIMVWLAPGVNIHRNPLCGRNFEYYSEDPLLAGKQAAGLIRGVQSQMTDSGIWIMKIMSPEKK